MPEAIQSVPAGTLDQSSLPRGDDACQSVLSFYTVEGLARGLTAGRWAVEEEIQILADFARNPDLSMDERVTAMNLIRQHMKESLILSGRMQQVVAQQTAQLTDGTVRTAQMQGARLTGPVGFLPAAQDTEQLLAAALHTAEIIEVTSERPDPSDASENPHSSPSSAGVGYRRDLGGGGLCATSQRRATAERELAASAAEGEEIGDPLDDLLGACPGDSGEVETGGSGDGGGGDPAGEEGQASGEGLPDDFETAMECESGFPAD